MKRLYLAASINRTGPAIAKDISGVLNKQTKDIKLAFITTAAEGSTLTDTDWLDNDRAGLVKGGFNLFDYTITGKSLTQINSELADCDVVHVNGGNSFYLLYQIWKSGFNKWINEQIVTGKKIYSASSAGTQVIAPDLEILRKPESKEYEEKLPNFKGMGVIDFVIFPHWGSVKHKDTYFDHRLKLSYKEENKIILLNNNQYVEVVGDMYKIKEISK